MIKQHDIPLSASHVPVSEAEYHEFLNRNQHKGYNIFPQIIFEEQEFHQ